MSLDLEEKDAASQRGIDEIRVLRDKVRFTPSSSKYKIFIIDEVHMLTREAFNALLKTLEEPPAHTIFVLATTESYKLPETVISRCQRFDFKTVPQEEVIERLQKIIAAEGRSLELDILKTIARRSGGCLRDAESVLGQILTVGAGRPEHVISWDEAELVIPRSNSELIKQFISHLEAKSAKEAVLVVNQLKEDGVDLEQFILDLIDELREKMLENIGKVEASFYNQLIDIFIRRLDDLKRISYLPQLPLELGVIDCLEVKGHPNIIVASVPVQSAESHPVSLTATQQAAANLTLDSVLNQWPEVLIKVKQQNNSLPVVLSACQPLRLDGNKLILGFKYKLHYQNAIKNVKTRGMLESIFFEIFKERLVIDGEIKEDLAINESTAENIQEVFGVL
jgi:DNA polymerase-3 subunit gamma/tau